MVIVDDDTLVGNNVTIRFVGCGVIVGLPVIVGANVPYKPSTFVGAYVRVGYAVMVGQAVVGPGVGLTLPGLDG